MNNYTRVVILGTKIWCSGRATRPVEHPSPIASHVTSARVTGPNIFGFDLMHPPVVLPCPAGRSAMCPAGDSLPTCRPDLIQSSRAVRPQAGMGRPGAAAAPQQPEPGRIQSKSNKKPRHLSHPYRRPDPSLHPYRRGGQGGGPDVSVCASSPSVPPSVPPYRDKDKPKERDFFLAPPGQDVHLQKNRLVHSCAESDSSCPALNCHCQPGL